MVNMNIFRVLGDLSHTASKCILIWAIHTNKSAEGVSLITQMLYAAVFCTRYLDMFWTPPAAMIWNFILKNFYIFSSFYIIIVMLKAFPRTREREKAWKFGGIIFAGALVGAPFLSLIFSRGHTNFAEILWVFSIILESICVLPQLLLLRQTTVPTVIDSFYLVTLGSYRAFYLLNWVLRLATEHYFDPIVVIFGIVQTAFYVDFAWVYWTRQRVKLRNGGVVDSEDLGRGWLVSRLMGHGRDSLDEEARNPDRTATNGSTKPANRGWGPRGVSISADDQVLDAHPKNKNTYSTGGRASHAEFVHDRVDAAAYQDRGLMASSEVSDDLETGREWQSDRK